MSEWISVKDQKPPYDTDVLLWDGKNRFVGQYLKDNTVDIDTCEFIDSFHVPWICSFYPTHWTEILPTPDED